MFRTVVDLNADTIEQVPLTAEEIAEIQSRPQEPLPAVSCSPWQIRKALNQLGLREAVEAAVAASPDITLKDGWEFATEFRSDDAFVLSMGQALSKTPDETRALIQMAAEL